MISIIWKNLKNAFEKYTFHMLILLLIEISVVITIFFSYGAYLNYLNEKNDDIFGSRHIAADFSKRAVSVKEIMAMEKELEGVFDTHLESICITTKNDKFRVYGVNEKKKSQYQFTDLTARERVEYGRYFTKDEEKNAEKVCISYWNDNRGLEYCGERFEQVGILKNWYGVDYSEVAENEPEVYYVPYFSLPETAVVDYLEIQIDRRVSAQMKEDFEKLLEKYFEGTAKVYVQETIAETENQISDGMMLIIGVMVILAAVNIYFTSQYVYERRKRMYATYRICGASRLTLFKILFAENYILVIGTVCTAWLLFDKLFIPLLLPRYKYFDEIYSSMTYAKITAVYLGVIFVLQCILAVGQLIKTPIDLWREK